MVIQEIGNIELKLLNGTIIRYPNDAPQYFDIGEMSNGNKILFYYPNATEIVNYVKTIVDKMPEPAIKYLEFVLANTTDTLVRCWYVAGAEMGCFEIYYDCDCKSNDLGEIVNWMRLHNDFAAEKYRFTQVVDGKQSCIR